jgi:hypothetical protein
VFALSNLFAHFKHEGQTEAWAGNSPDVIHRHYKGLVGEVDAAEFWNIRLGQCGTEIAKLPAIAGV